MTPLDTLNSQLSAAGVKKVKEIDLCPERTAYKEYLKTPNFADKERVKTLAILQKNYVFAFHKYFAAKNPHLLFEIGEDKNYWEYSEEKGIYEEATLNTIKRRLIELLIEEINEAVAVDRTAKDILLRFTSTNPNRGVNYDDFDSNDSWFHCKNGWVNIITKEFKEHSPKRLSRRVSNVAYDAEATCPIYDKFLDEDIQIKTDQIRVIDQFSGLLLTKDITKQKMLVIVGKPGSGKSTLLNIWMDVQGECAIQRRLTELSSDSSRFSGSDFVGRNLCWFDEVDVKRSEMSNNLGNLITGATINVERKGVTGIIAARNQTRCVLTANNLPMSTEQGIYRRMLIIKFERSFYDEGTEIANQLELMISESSGILNRMLRGLEDLRKMGRFTLMEGHAEMIEEYKASSDSVAEFLDTYFEPDMSENCNAYETAMLFQAYRGYVGERMSSTLTPQRFGRLVYSQPLDRFKHIKTKKGGKGIRQWLGLRLNNSFEVVDDKIVAKHSINF